MVLQFCRTKILHFVAILEGLKMYKDYILPVVYQTFQMLDPKKFEIPPESHAERGKSLGACY